MLYFGEKLFCSWEHNSAYDVSVSDGGWWGGVFKASPPFGVTVRENGAKETFPS